MLLSKLIGNRYREKPSGADIISYSHMLKGGYIRQLSNGIFTLLHPTKKIIMNIERIIREEMENIGGQEVLFPVVVPKELWDETGRYHTVGKELLRFKDRTNSDYVLSMTHEEAAVHLARSEATSYLKYPFMIFQIQTKFRDEPRSRGGLIRVREFTMKDGYSFHTSKEDLDDFYNIVLNSYEKIFKRCGLKNVIAVGSDTGMMGGDKAHEFMLLTDAGEDSIVICDQCGYSANMEIATSIVDTYMDEDKDLEKIKTQGIETIEKVSNFLNIDTNKMIKAVIFKGNTTGKTIITFIRADLDINETKLKGIIKENITPFNDYEQTNLTFGYIGPYKLKVDTNTQTYFDNSLKGCKNMVVGANEKDYHITGFNIERDAGEINFIDIKKVKENDKCIACGNPLKIEKGIEVGNIFELGTKYTKSMEMTYTDKDGLSKYPVMGCYGIGIGRLCASVVEESNDDFGPIWPYCIAPWKVHICALSTKNVSVIKEAKELYQKIKKNYETLLDDRELSPGVQFNDADLLGVPIRIIISPRNLENNKIEIKTRDKKINLEVPYEEIVETIDKISIKLQNEFE